MKAADRYDGGGSGCFGSVLAVHRSGIGAAAAGTNTERCIGHEFGSDFTLKQTARQTDGSKEAINEN